MRRLLLLPLAGLASALVVAPGPIPGSTTTTAAPTPAAPADVPWPDRRFAPCGALDADDGVLYVFGGRADDGATHLDDLWALDLGNGPRTRPSRLAAAAGAPSAPPAVRSCAAGWDGAAQELLVFGGWNGVDPRPGPARRSTRRPTSGTSSAMRCPAAPARRPAAPASSSSTKRAIACWSSAARTARTSTTSGRCRSTPRPGVASTRPGPALLEGDTRW